jgi:hypothetical protein
MPDTASLILVKEFPYRGAAEEFSNKYHFEGTVPATPEAWETLAEGWIQEERKIYTSAVKFVRAYGYEPSSDHANWVMDYTVPPETPLQGTFVGEAGSSIAPGDAAATVRWDTGMWNTRGKKIYCRKYFHGVSQSAASHDTVDPTQVAAYNAYAAVVISGFFPGSVKYCAPQGANLSSPVTSQWITTRTLKRRGKRPLPSGG